MRVLKLAGRVGAVAVLFLSCAYGSTRVGPALGTWLALQRQVTPRAVVTSGFLDWRTVSRYRTHAGLHFGYDIAMPPGSPVVTGWTGQVTAIVPWTDDQSGITVMGADGFETTYGHLRPRVRVGDALCPGDPVGITVIDHVDIKMRGPSGVWYDFGHPSAIRESVAAAPRIATVSDETLRKAREQVQSYDEMFEAGAVSRDVRDRVRRRYQALTAEAEQTISVGRARLPAR